MEKIDRLTYYDWLQIEQAARGCIDSPLDEWPLLVRAIGKVRGKLEHRETSAWARGFCEALVCVRDAREGK